MLVHPVRRRRVQHCPALPRRPSEGTPAHSRDPVAAPERGPTGPARSRPPPQRPALRPARGRFRDRYHHCLPVHHRGHRTPGRPRPHARRSSKGRVDEGVPHPGRDTSADRPDRHRPALLLGQIPKARHERAGHSRSEGPTAVGFTGPGRSGPRCTGRTRARHHRHSRPGWHHLLGRQGLPGRRRDGASPFPRPLGEVVHWPAGRQRYQAKIWALVEQAIATLKSWRLLRKLRCSTTRITNIVQAVLTLQLAGSG